MAGQPRKRALLLELEQRTRLRFEDDEHTMLDYVADWCESKTLKALANELAEDQALLEGLQGVAITKLLRDKFGQDETDRRLAAARRIMAQELVESAIVDAEDVAEDKDAIAKLRVKNDVRMWTAERYNRDQFGQPKQVGVTINVGSLSLDSFRRRSVAAPSAPQLAAPAEDAEVITIESSG